MCPVVLAKWKRPRAQNRVGFDLFSDVSDRQSLHELCRLSGFLHKVITRQKLKTCEASIFTPALCRLTSFCHTLEVMMCTVSDG